jgi:nitroimidazol reductase NimA-like FMN-containing flavoprotein (pyridoxamine 5'-phosphate oxidase superfamily)
MRLPKKVAALLARERVCRVATVGSDGTPHIVAVCHVLAEGKVYFGTGSDGQKARNLRANPRLTVLADIYAEDWSILRGAMVRGTARLIGRGRDFRKIRTLLYEKYPQYPEEAGLAESEDLIVEMTPTAVASWGLD